MKTILVTGGAGFIGSCFVREAIAAGETKVVNLDALTYAGNMESIPAPSERHVFVKGNVGDGSLVSTLLREHHVDSVIHFAAESDVDRSIDGPSKFIDTNVTGTLELLNATLDFFRDLSESARKEFRLLHVSTDEVYGSLGPTGHFTEQTPYDPSSPYSASKAASDHLVRAWHRTYGLPTIVAHCSNNYGPYQFPEKLIPLMTLNAMEGKPLPVYGDGLNVRDWLHVADHCDALRVILDKGTIGKTYNIGGDCEQTNLDIVHAICRSVNELMPELTHRCEDLITFVTDRPGHDRRYAIDASQIKSELGWSPSFRFEDGIRETVCWYKENRQWVTNVTTGVYQRQRLGMTVPPLASHCLSNDE